MPMFVLGRELRGIVFVLIEQAKCKETPIDFVTRLGRYLRDPAGGDPRKGAHRVPEKLDVVGVAHTLFLFSDVSRSRSPNVYRLTTRGAPGCYWGYQPIP